MALPNVSANTKLTFLGIQGSEGGKTIITDGYNNALANITKAMDDKRDAAVAKDPSTIVAKVKVAALQVIVAVFLKALAKLPTFKEPEVAEQGPLSVEQVGQLIVDEISG
jgi:hypothetical protein